MYFSHGYLVSKWLLKHLLSECMMKIVHVSGPLILYTMDLMISLERNGLVATSSYGQSFVYLSSSGPSKFVEEWEVNQGAYKKHHFQDWSTAFLWSSLTRGHELLLLLWLSFSSLLLIRFTFVTFFFLLNSLVLPSFWRFPSSSFQLHLLFTSVLHLSC